jgi:hypothetical protein
MILTKEDLAFMEKHFSATKFLKMIGEVTVVINNPIFNRFRRCFLYRLNIKKCKFYTIFLGSEILFHPDIAEMIIYHELGHYHFKDLDLDQPYGLEIEIRADKYAMEQLKLAPKEAQRRIAEMFILRKCFPTEESQLRIAAFDRY